MKLDQLVRRQLPSSKCNVDTGQQEYLTQPADQDGPLGCASGVSSEEGVKWGTRSFGEVDAALVGFPSRFIMEGLRAGEVLFSQDIVFEPASPPFLTFSGPNPTAEIDALVITFGGEGVQRDV